MATIDTTAERAALDAVPTRLLIGGEWRDATGGATLPVEDPSTGKTLTEVADATVADGLSALAAADGAFGEFRQMAPRERGEILRRAYELMTESAERLALLMTLEMGKPLAESRGEVAYAASYFRWYAEEATRINGRFQVAENGLSRVLTMQQPVGPCIFITPWNFPLAMGTRKVGPAIAAGCTCVVKPAKQTPLSMLAMAQILEQAGLPAGVVNVVTAARSGELMEPMIRDPRARKLSFTGSTPVGKRLVEQASEQLLRMSMELGGNAPFVVFEDADLDLAIEGALLAKMRNIGEACTSANRFVVEQSIADEFARRLAERMGALKIARGTDPESEVGPLIDQAAIDKVDELVQDATAKGAALLTGGERVGETGYFYRPTVLGRGTGAGAGAEGGDLRPGRADRDVLERGAGTGDGQRHRVRARRVPLHARLRPGVPHDGGPRDGDDRAQPGDGLERGRPVRRRQAVGLRPRGRPRGSPGVPGDQVRGDEPRRER